MGDFPFVFCVLGLKMSFLSHFFSRFLTLTVPASFFPYPPLLSQNAKFPFQHLLVFWSQEAYFQRQIWKGKAQIHPWTEFFIFKRACTLLEEKVLYRTLNGSKALHIWNP